MSGLPILTWLRFFGWLVIGLTIYWLYSRHHSEFAGQRQVEGADLISDRADCSALDSVQAANFRQSLPRKICPNLQSKI